MIVALLAYLSPPSPAPPAPSPPNWPPFTRVANPAHGATVGGGGGANTFFRVGEDRPRPGVMARVKYPSVSPLADNRNCSWVPGTLPGVTSVPVAMPRAACADYAVDFAANNSALSCEGSHSCVPAPPECDVAVLVERGSKCTSLDVSECDGSYWVKSNGKNQLCESADGQCAVKRTCDPPQWPLRKDPNSFDSDEYVLAGAQYSAGSCKAVFAKGEVEVVGSNSNNGDQRSGVPAISSSSSSPGTWSCVTAAGSGKFPTPGLEWPHEWLPFDTWRPNVATLDVGTIAKPNL